MGLSPDPEKRARQQANLRKGWEINAHRLTEPAAESPDPDSKPAAPADGLEVVPYASTQPDTPPSAPKRRPARRAAKPKPEPEPAGPEPEPEPERERRRGALGELAAGFFGGS